MGVSSTKIGSFGSSAGKTTSSVISGKIISVSKEVELFIGAGLLFAGIKISSLTSVVVISEVEVSSATGKTSRVELVSSFETVSGIKISSGGEVASGMGTTSEGALVSGFEIVSGVVAGVLSEDSKFDKGTSGEEVVSGIGTTSEGALVSGTGTMVCADVLSVEITTGVSSAETCAERIKDEKTRVKIIKPLARLGFLKNSFIDYRIFFMLDLIGLTITT